MDYEKIKDIADYYGYEDQSMQLIEEMAELTQEINKFRREKGKISGDTAFTRKKVIEEMADVWIMLQQIAYLMGATDEISDEIERKIDRQMQRIDEEIEDQRRVPVIYGVHGIHMRKAYKVFKWRVPEDITVKVGDLAVVPAAGKWEYVLVVGKGTLPNREAKKLAAVIHTVCPSEIYDVPKTQDHE